MKPIKTHNKIKQTRWRMSIKRSFFDLCTLLDLPYKIASCARFQHFIFFAVTTKLCENRGKALGLQSSACAPVVSISVVALFQEHGLWLCGRLWQGIWQTLGWYISSPKGTDRGSPRCERPHCAPIRAESWVVCPSTADLGLGLRKAAHPYQFQSVKL